MARNLTTQDISWFLDMHEKGQLDLDPPYQRRSVWSPRDKRFFVDTILNNYPAPPVFLHKSLDDNGRSTYHVVDGKQRIQTIIEFTKDKVRVPDDFSDVTLRGKRWKDLQKPVRERVWNYSLAVEMLPDVSDAAVRNIFDRINRNARKLMPQEMRHAKYDGWFIATAEAEAEKQEWKTFGVVTAARMRRMADVQFISELLGIIIKKRVEGFDQDTLDDLYADYEDLAEQQTFLEDDFNTEIERIKTYIREALTIEPRIRDYLKVQSHFYSLWAYTALESETLLPVAKFAHAYFAFLAEVSAIIDSLSVGAPQKASNLDNVYASAALSYATNTRGASTDLPPRTNRHSALVIALHPQKR